MATAIDAAQPNRKLLPNCAQNLHLKAKAHQELWKALGSGVLVKPKTCSRCRQRKFTIVGHYADYSRFLEVEWLCGSCHKKAHWELYRAAKQ